MIIKNFMFRALIVLSLILGIFSFLNQTVSAAEIHRWVDEKGEIHYSNAPTKNAEEKQQLQKVMTYPEEMATERDSKEPVKSKDASDEIRSKKEISIYTTATCPYCHRAKDYLSKKGLKFTEIDVQRNREGLNRMTEISGQTGVPVIVINGDVIIGFNPHAIDDKLR